LKAINVYFDDDELLKLLKVKGKLSWHDFIMRLAK
jgi:predicted CopG family antitoxin